MTEQLANSLATKAAPFISQIEAIEKEMDSITGQHMSRLKAKREERKTIYQSAKDNGVPTRPLKGTVKRRKLERKIDAIDKDFDIDESAAYRELADGALGDLGVAAAARAGHTKNGDDRDLRPAHMRRTEQERAADAGNLDKVGRGKTDPVDVARG